MGTSTTETAGEDHPEKVRLPERIHKNKYNRIFTER
jgi:hypothetical protein